MKLPDTTILNQKIPKEKFYANLETDSKIKDRFQKEINSIHLKNKLSKETTGVKGNKEVEEIFVFSIVLKDEKYLEGIEDLLLLIDRAIPYPILYEFEFGKRKVYKIAYKERSKANENESVVDVYFTREILNEKMFDKEINNVFNSLNLEILYGKLVKIILQDKSKINLKELVGNYKRKIFLKEEICILEKKVKIEKQADRQFKILNELGVKIKELERLG